MLHQIGAGSLGPVFLGDDPARGGQVAIKSLRVDLPPERSLKVADELAALATRLPMHPSVVAPVDAGLADLVPYVVWPLVEGVSLDVALREYGPAACVDALPRLATLADALDRAAAQGAWHGALHPRDLLITDDDTWVIGLGVAPILERSGVRLSARRPYTAPEQIDGHATSPSSDQFALAAIAHEWLFGRRVAGPANESLTVPQLPGVDRTWMTSAFATALAVDPQGRFPSCADFIVALERAVIDRHEAKIESMARAARRQGKAPAGVVPTLPLEDEAFDAAGAGVVAEPARFQTIEADDDPLDRFIAPLAPPVITLDSDEGLQLAPDDLDPPARLSVTDGHDDALLDGGAVDADDDVAEAGDSADGGDVVDDPEVDEEGGDEPRQMIADEGRPATSVESQSRLVDQPGAMFGGDGRTDGRVAGSFGAGSIAAALFVGLVIGTAAGYALALRQPVTTAVVDVASEPADAVAGEPAAETVETPAAAVATGQPFTDAALPPASAPPAASAPPSAPSAASATPPAVTGTSAPPPAAAPVERPGRLLVRSTPAGAEVRVDGEVRGVTPLALRDLPLATHVVRVASAGFVTAEHRIALTEARPSRSLDVPLARPAAPAPAAAAAPPTAAVAEGSLLVESRPAGATVRIDDRAAGTTPLTLPGLAPGSYRVTIAREGYQTWTTTVQVVAGERARVAASLVGGRFEE